MSTIPESFQYPFGDRTLEFAEIAKGRWREDQVILNKEHTRSKYIRIGLKRYMDQEVEKRKIEAEKKEESFFDGRMASCRGVELSPSSLTISWGPSSYFKKFYTNDQLDNDEIMIDKNGEPITPREKYKIDSYNPTKFNDPLQNTMGASYMLITEDNKVFIGMRSGKITTYPDRWGISPAGMVDPKRDIVDGKLNPFNTARREAREELDGTELTDVVITGIGRPHDTMGLEIYGTCRTEKNSYEIMEGVKKSKKLRKTFGIDEDPGVLEHTEEFFVPFTVEDILSPERLSDPNKEWVLAHLIAPKNELEHVYGEKAVNERIYSLNEELEQMSRKI